MTSREYRALGLALVITAASMLSLVAGMALGKAIRTYPQTTVGTEVPRQ